MVARSGGDRLEVRAGTERSRGAGEDGNVDPVVAVDVVERRLEGGGGRTVDRVADLGAIDRDHR